MINESRRAFFKTFLSAGAALAASGAGGQLPRAEASETPQGRIKGVCLYVPSLGQARDFVELMNTNARGDWTVHPLTGTLTETYLQTKGLYQDARKSANTLVGVVDPATFAIVHEAIVDSGGCFHYVTYEAHNRVTFSVQL